MTVPGMLIEMRDDGLTAASRQPTPREEIIALFRGSYAVPVLTTLDQFGVVAALIEKPCSAADFPAIANRAALEAMLAYLEGLGLLTRAEGEACGRYAPSTLGRRLLRRIGGAHILRSYRAYFDRLPELLATPSKPVDIVVDRVQNLMGCTSLHPLKYFAPALDLLGGEPVAHCIDIGSGDGAWLSAVADRWPEVRATGVDLSKDAFAEGWAALQARLPGRVHSVLGDGREVSKWSEGLPRVEGRTLISCWFVIHEFCGGRVENAVRFFQDLRRHHPSADLLIGEIVAVDTQLLASAHRQSIMPEFLLFHALSGQTPLTAAQWHQVRGAIPYRTVIEHPIDPIGTAHNRLESASFLWHLAP